MATLLYAAFRDAVIDCRFDGVIVGWPFSKPGDMGHRTMCADLFARGLNHSAPNDDQSNKDCAQHRGSSHLATIFVPALGIVKVASHLKFSQTPRGLDSSAD
jgi:hypothetical protein